MELTEEERYTKALLKVKELKAFYGHLFVFLIIMSVLCYKNYTESPGYLWVLFPLFGWGFGLLMHGIRVLGKPLKWEERKIEKYLNDENF